MSRRYSWMLLAVLGGCGRLVANPGDDFHIKLQTAAPLALVQQVAPVELVFEVAGCDKFEAVVDTAGVGVRRQHRLAPTKREDGLFSAIVPVDFLRADTDYCLYDAVAPEAEQAQLVATCQLDGRTARSESFAVSYATAWRASWRGRGPVDAVLPGADPGTFFTVGSGWLDFNDATGLRDDTYAAIQPGRAPLLAQTSTSVYLWAGCPLNDCGNFWVVDTPQVKIGTMASYVQVFPFDSAQGSFPSLARTIPVPADGVDLVVEPGADVVLLSSFTGGTVLSRIRGSDVVASPVFLGGEIEPTHFGKLGADRVFLTRVAADSSRVRLRRIDGSLLGEFGLDGSGTLSHLSLAPSGDQWLYIRGGEVRMAGLQQPGILVATDLGRSLDAGSTWLRSGIALWDQGRVEIFSRQGPHILSSQVKPLSGRSETSAAPIQKVLAMGDSIALLTGSGVQIFDGAGQLIGGADPVPARCGLSFSPFHAAAVDDLTAVLGGSSAVYRFRADPSLNSP